MSIIYVIDPHFVLNFIISYAYVWIDFLFLLPFSGTQSKPIEKNMADKNRELQIKRIKRRNIFIISKFTKLNIKSHFKIE